MQKQQQHGMQLEKTYQENVAKNVEIQGRE